MTTISTYLPNTLRDKVTKDTKLIECEIDIGYGIIVSALAFNDEIIIGYDKNKWSPWEISLGALYKDSRIEKVDPFISIKTIGTIYHKNIIRSIYCLDTNIHSRFSTWGHRNKEALDTYDDHIDYGWDYNYNSNDRKFTPGPPYNYLKLQITANDGTVAEVEIKFRRPTMGTINLSNATANNIPVNLDLFGTELKWNIDIIGDRTHNKFFDILKQYTILPSKKDFWKLYFDFIVIGERSTKGVKSVETNKKIAPNLSKLKDEDPILYKFYLWLHSDKIKGGISNNQCLAAFLKVSGENYESLKTELTSVMDNAKNINSHWDELDITREICLLFDAAKSKDEEKRAHKEWYLKKTTGEQAVGLGIDPEKYPLLYKAVSEQEIPLGVFHNPTDKLSMINVEFDLWEEALNRTGWAEILYKIAQNASGRNTYERDIIPYISFLFKIEQYLYKHAPGLKLWSAMPTYVNSEWQLEMDEATEEGTVKKRSALTPVADNEKQIVTVPYAAIAMSGRQTTYCYSKHYFVFEQYMLDDESGSVITKDLEIKLNGKDDYGLMYYTLTGTPRNRGYPTFLIIFERLESKTRVHFHRVHPNRYKDGKPTPACRLIEECYRYMAGNIRAEEICAQQGDLIFIKCEEPSYEHGDLIKIKDFESHAFVSISPDEAVAKSNEYPVFLLENKAKSIKNRLGHIFCGVNFELQHPEHDNVHMKDGWYEVRRCKSWEANPKAVWSITID